MLADRQERVKNEAVDPASLPPGCKDRVRGRVAVHKEAAVQRAVPPRGYDAATGHGALRVAPGARARFPHVTPHVTPPRSRSVTLKMAAAASAAVRGRRFKWSLELAAAPGGR